MTFVLNLKTHWSFELRLLKYDVILSFVELVIFLNVVNPIVVEFLSRVFNRNTNSSIRVDTDSIPLYKKENVTYVFYN